MVLLVLWQFKTENIYLFSFSIAPNSRKTKLENEKLEIEMKRKLIKIEKIELTGSRYQFQQPEEREIVQRCKATQICLAFSFRFLHKLTD